LNGQSPTERGCLKDFVASMLGRGSISFWGKEDLNAAFLHFGDVFTKLLLIGSILPIIWRTSYLPAWYFSAITGIYNAPFNLIGVIRICGIEIPAVVSTGYPIPPDFQIYAPHTPWPLISSLLSSSALATLTGSIAYSYYAYKKTVETGVSFTSPPFGPSIPAAFLMLSGVIVTFQHVLNLDLYTAVSVAITANLLCSALEAALALGLIDHIENHLPLPGVLGTVAGIGFAWIITGLFAFAAGTPIGGIYGAMNDWPQLNPAIGVIVAVIMLSGLVLKAGASKLPTVPLALIAGMVMVVINTLYLGYLSPLGDPAFYFKEVWIHVFGGVGPQFMLAYVLGLDPAPYAHLGCFSMMTFSFHPEILGRGLNVLPTVAAVAVPLQVYDTLESYANTKACNIELARRLGISGEDLEDWIKENGYSPSTIMVIDACASLLSVPFGGWIPTVNYVGSSGYVKIGAKSGYPIISSLLLLSLTWTGVFYLVPLILPITVVAPSLLFIGGVTVIQAFREVYEESKFLGEGRTWGDLFAVASAITPHFFSMIATMLALNFTFSLTGTAMSDAIAPYRILTDVFYIPVDVGGLIVRIPYAQYLGMYGYGVNTTFNYASLMTGWSGIAFLGLNATLIGLIWGSIISDLNRGNFRRALAFSLAAALLSAAGLMHAASIPTSMLDLQLTAAWALAYVAISAYVALLRRAK